VTPASIGIKTDDYTKHNAHGTNLYREKDHQGVFAAFRASLRIKPISAHAPEWLGVVLNAQGSRPPLQNRRRPLGRK
jgi:hypothetical protein